MTDNSLDAVLTYFKNPLDPRVGGLLSAQGLFLQDVSVQVPFVVAMCLLYIVVVKSLPSVLRGRTTGTSSLFVGFVALHNLALCLFSGWIFVSFMPLLLRSIAARGWWGNYCDKDESLWAGGMDVITYWFYLSKIWEFLDTAILLVKQKPASWLQTYHHVGAFIGMWLLVKSRSPTVMFFIALNSALHTIMYMYFFLSGIGQGHLVQWAKQLITTLQMAQFVVGFGIGAASSIPYFFGLENMLYGGPKLFDCMSAPKAFAMTFNAVYLIPLFALFLNFYIKAYVAKGKRQKRE